LEAEAEEAKQRVEALKEKLKLMEEQIVKVRLFLVKETNFWKSC
jgi:enamine deaminase RidA (YjgF/YER057c/UK114 family)